MTMNFDMTSQREPAFRSGDVVQERGGGVRGCIVGPGRYPGEWRLVCADGREITCLSENLLPSTRTYSHLNPRRPSSRVAE